MSAGSNLLRLIRWDIRLQARENIYSFTAFTTAVFAVVILLLPADASHTVVTGILFLDPAIVGLSFVGSIILMERGQNTLAALSVSPAEPREYVLAKIVTLTGLTFAGGMLLVAIAYHPLPWDRALRFMLTMAFTGTLSVLAGLVVIAKSQSMNHFLARLVPIAIVIYLPLLAHFGIVDGVWTWLLFGLDPGHAVLRALLWAAEPAHVPLADTLYAFAYMSVLIAFFFRWSLSIYGDDFVQVSA